MNKHRTNRFSSYLQTGEKQDIDIRYIVEDISEDLQNNASNLNNQIITNDDVHQLTKEQPTTNENESPLQSNKNNPVVQNSGDNEIIDCHANVEDVNTGDEKHLETHSDCESIISNDENNFENDTNYDADDDNENSDADYKNDDDAGNNGDENNYDYNDIDLSYSDDDDIPSSLNQENVEQNHWKEDAETDLNDPSLLKHQQLTLSILIKSRTLISMIRNSSILNLYFNQKREKSNIKRNILRDIETRWNSTFQMIDALMIVQPLIENLFNDKHNLNIDPNQIERLNQLEITSAEWNHLKQLQKVLDGFNNATKIASGKNYPSMGSAYYVLYKLKTFLMKDSKDNIIVKTMKRSLYSKMVHYFDEDRIQLNLLKFHSYFDPVGYRVLSDADKRWIEYDIKKIFSNSTSSLISSSLPSSSTAATTTSSINVESPSTPSATLSTNTSTPSTTNTRKKTTPMEAFLISIGEDIDSDENTHPRSTIIEELHAYRSLVEKFNSRNRVPDPLLCMKFWKTAEFSLPCLFKLSNKFTCTPATSVPSEAAFSISSYVYKKERSKLSAQNLEATVFLKDKLDD